MKYIHQSTYGHAGGFHTMKPIMAMDKNHVYNMVNGRPDTGKPIYAIREGKMFATHAHPDGPSQHATFEIRGDKIHTTANHPAHTPGKHLFVIKPGEMYT